MSHRHGAHIGGIVTLEDLRQRCFITDDFPCWHLRSARGRPMPHGDRHVVWSHRHCTKLTATRLAWLLARPHIESWPEGLRAWRTCASYDCVNPQHIKAGTFAQWGRHMAASGKAVTPAKTAAQLVMARSRSVLTPELRLWLLESTQSGVDAAHGLGIAQSRANQLRASARNAKATLPVASVFEFAMRLAA